MAMLRALFARDRPLALAAAVMACGLLVAGAVAPFDARIVTGVNPWLKPMKFLASIAIFLATMAWFTPELRASDRARARLRRVFIWTMTIEIVCIALQAARGTTSHFNHSTSFDAAVFQLMGAAITINTVAAAVMLWLLRRDTPAGRAGYLTGVRLGLAVFVVGSLQGFVIVANLGHNVPGPDGGPGLPLLNWSVSQGDLRVAHFIGLHALQALPLLGYGLDRTSAPAGARRSGVWIAAVFWFGVMGALLAMATRGQPLIAHW
jgi:hypothetical protein